MSADLMTFLEMKLLVSSEDWEGDMAEKRTRILNEGINVT
jgi:hypothetical protein